MATGKRSARDPEKVERARLRIRHGGDRGDIARIQKAICVPARLEIIQALLEGPLVVEDLARAINRAVPATSQHLRVLRTIGLVEGRRSGNTVIYSLRQGRENTHLREVVRALEQRSNGHSHSL